ncbi:MAG: helix-turn-helix domain-containing protein [Candidatus Micrarchaeia archaeon]
MSLFSKLELRTFQMLNQSGRSNVSNLALGLNISKSAVSRAVASLEKKGLVESKKGRRKDVQVARSVSARPFEEFINANPSVDFARVFENSNLQVLAALCFRESSSFKSIIRTTGLTQVTARRSISSLSNAGIIARRPGGYAILLPGLSNCVLEYLRVVLVAREGTIGSFLQAGPYAFIRTNRPVGFVPTGLSAFPKYGVPLVVDSNDYVLNAFFNPKAPRLEDAVLHGLFRVKLNASSREASYCLLAIAKNWRKFNWGLFVEHSQDYALENEAQQCKSFFDGFSSFLFNGKKVSEPIITLPSKGIPYQDYKSFLGLCNEYGVDTKALQKAGHRNGNI